MKRVVMETCLNILVLRKIVYDVIQNASRYQDHFKQMFGK